MRGAKDPDTRMGGVPPRAPLRRRELLKLAGGLAGTVLASDGRASAGASTQPAPPAGRAKKRVIVAGGGIRGPLCGLQRGGGGPHATRLPAGGGPGGPP